MKYEVKLQCTCPVIMRVKVDGISLRDAESKARAGLTRSGWNSKYWKTARVYSVLTQEAESLEVVE